MEVELHQVPFWPALKTYLVDNGHGGAVGTALKSTSGWNSGGNGTDVFGFSALPVGYRSHSNGDFDFAGYSGFWWSTSPAPYGNAWSRYLGFNGPGISRNYYSPRVGFSVRCLRDAE